MSGKRITKSERNKIKAARREKSRILSEGKITVRDSVKNLRAVSR